MAALGAKIEQKQIEFDVLSERVLNYDKAKDELSNLEIELDTAPKYQLPEPEKFMTAKAYKTKMAEPVVRKLKQLVKTVLARCFEGWDNYHMNLEIHFMIHSGKIFRKHMKVLDIWNSLSTFIICLRWILKRKL